MGSVIDEPFGAAIPSIPLRHSPLTFVVVQVRFPLVVSIGEESFIGPFQERIRPTYGDLRREDESRIEVGPDGVRNVKGGTVWRFSGTPGGWEVALTPEFIALATSRYTDREDFLGRLRQLLTAVDEWLQPAKVRRLGVRYIDRVHEHHLQRLSELLRPEVLGPYNVGRPDVERASQSTGESRSLDRAGRSPGRGGPAARPALPGEPAHRLAGPAIG